MPTFCFSDENELVIFKEIELYMSYDAEHLDDNVGERKLRRRMREMKKLGVQTHKPVSENETKRIKEVYSSNLNKKLITKEILNSDSHTDEHALSREYFTGKSSIV